MTEEDAVRQDATEAERSETSDPETAPEPDDAGPDDTESDDAETVDAESLAARVAAHDEDLGAEVATLADRVDELEAEAAERAEEVDSLTERLQRARADFQNYKKRAERQREEIRERATEDLVERLLDVRDNLDRALDQGGDAESVREGVEATLRSFDEILEDENVSPIEPSPGDDVDPHRHEVMMRVESDRPADTVAEVYRQGYEMADTVLRTAQVAVSDGE